MQVGLYVYAQTSPRMSAYYGRRVSGTQIMIKAPVPILISFPHPQCYEKKTTQNSKVTYTCKKKYRVSGHNTHQKHKATVLRIYPRKVHVGKLHLEESIL
jgi:hypothetical protein